jgi:hypothetical protein
LTLLLITSLTIACTEEDKMTSEEEIRTLIRKELPVGSSSHEIESFFLNHKIEFGFDKYAMAYQGVIKRGSVAPWLDKKICIDIYVDEKKRFVREEVIVFLK